MPDLAPCPKCSRRHRGVCCIPAGVMRGYGARVGGSSRANMTIPLSHYRPLTKLKGTAVLESLLTQAQAELAKVLAMLQKVPPEMEEYTLLLDREGKLDEIIKQLHQQIGVAKRK